MKSNLETISHVMFLLTHDNKNYNEYVLIGIYKNEQIHNIMKRHLGDYQYKEISKQLTVIIW